jgi:four helix bundle protein
MESRQLSKDIYRVFKSQNHFYDRPLSLQIIRSSGSTVDNIAEGFERGGNKEFLQYLWISKASAGECRSQLYRALDHDVISEDSFQDLKSRVELRSVKIYKFIKHLKESDFKGIKYSN